MEKRGQLSSLDLLSAEAQDEIDWAKAQLNKRERTQADILFELNDKLAVKGLGPISKSAFNRAAVRSWMLLSKRTERAEVMRIVAQDRTPASTEELETAIIETSKAVIYDMLEMLDANGDPKAAKELVSAFRTTLQAEALSKELRAAMWAEFAAQTGAAIEKVGTAKGLSGETVDAIKAQILGIRKEAA